MVYAQYVHGQYSVFHSVTNLVAVGRHSHYFHLCAVATIEISFSTIVFPTLAAYSDTFVLRALGLVFSTTEYRIVPEIYRDIVFDSFVHHQYLPRFL